MYMTAMGRKPDAQNPPSPLPPITAQNYHIHEDVSDNKHCFHLMVS
jgi:hypothetical protein